MLRGSSTDNRAFLLGAALSIWSIGALFGLLVGKDHVFRESEVIQAE